jgi:hypothetical protein
MLPHEFAIIGAAGAGGASSPVTLVGITSARNGNPTVHGSAAEDDIGLLLCCYSGLNLTPDIDITVSGNWETQELWTPPTTVACRLFGWWDAFGATPTAPTFSGATQAGNYEWIMIVLRGADLTSPVNDSSCVQVPDPTNNQATEAVTSTVDNTYIVTALAQRGYTTLTVVSHGDYDNPALLNQGSTTGVDTGLVVLSMEKPTAGTPAAGTIDSQNVSQQKASVAIAPA